MDRKGRRNVDRQADLRERARHLRELLEGLPEQLLSDEEKLKRKELEDEISRERAMTCRVFVGNLSHTITLKTLRRVFRICGPIKRLDIACLTYREDSTCYAEIDFGDPRAYTAATDLNGLLLEGRALVVCRKRTELPEWRHHARLKGTSKNKTDQNGRSRHIGAQVVKNPFFSSVDASRLNHK